MKVSAKHDELVGKLKNRALARRSLKALSRTARYDAELDDEAVAALTDLQAELDGLRGAVTEARLQLEYLDGRWPTGTTPAVIAKIDQALSQHPHDSLGS